MDIQKFRKKLYRYIKGRSNETENALIDAWYKSYAVNEQPLNEKEEQTLRESIQHKIKLATSKPQIFNLPAFRIAASVTIISTASLLLWKYGSVKKEDITTYYTVETGTKGIKQVILPDSSVIWLNSASRIKVPVAYRGHFREVKLEEGEAFFDVKRNRQHPFIIQTNELNVQVLGTSFNVRNYKSLSNIRVSVVTGKVGITKNGHTLAMLLPGQQLNYECNTGNYQQEIINPDNVKSWKDGYTYLSQANFKELSLIIKNTFGLSLKAGNDRVNAYRFSLRVEHDIPAEQLLKVISLIHNTHFRKEGNDIILF